jgi:hypothetical protein
VCTLHDAGLGPCLILLHTCKQGAVPADDKSADLCKPLLGSDLASASCLPFGNRTRPSRLGLVVRDQGTIISRCRGDVFLWPLVRRPLDHFS